MGSIMMHLGISEKIKEKYHFSKQFLVGAVLPDIYKRTRMTRDESHYIDAIEEKGWLYLLPNLERYVLENKNRILNDEIVLGYFAHLVEDYVWFRHIIGYVTRSKPTEYIEERTVWYRKENFEIAHTVEECNEETYQDYMNLDAKFYHLFGGDLEEFKSDLKAYLNDSDASKMVDEEFILHSPIPGRENYFVTEEFADRYIRASLELFDMEYTKLLDKK